MRGVILTLALCLALAGCKTTEEALKETGKKPLTSAQIKGLLSGKTTVGTNTKGRSYEVMRAADGKMDLTAGSFSDKGKWWVEGPNLYCSQWNKLRNGEKGCRRVYDIGEKYQFISLDGSEGAVFTIK